MTSRERAVARLGRRLTVAEVRAGKRGRDFWQRLNGWFPIREGRAAQCRCRRWFVAQTLQTWKAHVSPLFGPVPAGSRVLHVTRCRVCAATMEAAQRTRQRAARSRQRAARRSTITCGACGRRLGTLAERSTRRFCNGTCRQRARRNAIGNGRAVTHSISVTGAVT